MALVHTTPCVDDLSWKLLEITSTLLDSHSYETGSDFGHYLKWVRLQKTGKWCDGAAEDSVVNHSN